MGLWGEKVPATVGTVAKRFALVELSTLDVEGAWLRAQDTRPAAGGTGLGGAQGVGLLGEAGLQGAFGETRGSGLGDLLQGGKIDVASGAVVPEDAAGDDFAPLSRKITEFLELLRGKWTARHSGSCLGVRTTEPRAFCSTR